MPIVITTLEAVQTPLIDYLDGGLKAYYPEITVTHSIVAGFESFDQNEPFILMTLYKHRPPQTGRRHEWELLLDMSVSLAGEAGVKDELHSQQDRTLVDRVNALVNGDEGYRALRSLGLYSPLDGMPMLRAMAEDQADNKHINPHLFSCVTYAR
jgi:hypothetical protein